MGDLMARKSMPSDISLKGYDARNILAGRHIYEVKAWGLCRRGESRGAYLSDTEDQVSCIGEL